VNRVPVLGEGGQQAEMGSRSATIDSAVAKNRAGPGKKGGEIRRPKGDLIKNHGKNNGTFLSYIKHTNGRYITGFTSDQMVHKGEKGRRRISKRCSTFKTWTSTAPCR